MGNIKYAVWKYPATETGSYNITNAVDLKDNDGINIQAGTYTVTFTNNDSEMANTLLYGDKLKIELGYEDTGITNVIFGRVEEESYQVNNARRIKIVKGAGPSRELQNYVTSVIIRSGTNQTYSATAQATTGSYVYTYDNISSATMVKYLVSQFVNNSSDDTVNIDYDTYVDIGSACKPWKNTLGDEFYKTFVNSDVGRALDTMRGDTFTGAGDYDFYVDNENYLHFEPRGKTTSSVNLVEGSNIISFSADRNIKSTYNAILMFCGRDHDGIGIYAAGFNANGVAQAGFKWGYVNNGELWNNVSGILAGEALSDIRAATLEQGRLNAKTIAERAGLPKWEVETVLKGTTQYTLTSGQQVMVYLPSVGPTLNPKSLILTGVKHDVSNRGWLTTLTLNEAAGEIF